MSVLEKVVCNNLVWVAAVTMLSPCGILVEYRHWLQGDINDKNSAWKKHLKNKREMGIEILKL